MLSAPTQHPVGHPFLHFPGKLPRSGRCRVYSRHWPLAPKIICASQLPYLQGIQNTTKQRNQINSAFLTYSLALGAVSVLQQEVSVSIVRFLRIRPVFILSPYNHSSPHCPADTKRQTREYEASACLISYYEYQSRPHSS